MARDTSSGMEATVIDPSNMTHLIGRFKGPPDTPYENGEFKVDIQLPDTYPFAPPKMKFSTKVWHPNISSQTVCISFYPLLLEDPTYRLILREQSASIPFPRNGPPS